MSAATLTAALAYAGRGWPVFALSRTKAPLKLCGSCPPHSADHDGETCACLTCHGFYAATTEPLAVIVMFSGHPDRLVAVRTGAPSGLVVVDVDPRSGGEQTLGYLTQAGLLPTTVAALSGGGGLHLLYAHPGGIVHGGGGKLGPGVDVKADGGYFIVAPSVHPGTGVAYRWSDRLPLGTPPTELHPEILERLRPTVVATVSRPATWSNGGGRGRLLGVLTRLAEERSNRNDVLFWATKKVAVMHHAGALPDLDAAVAALRAVALQVGLTDSEVGDESRGTIRSGLLAVHK